MHRNILFESCAALRPSARHVALNRGLMIVFVTLMRCDDCRAQPRQPGLNAAAAFGMLRYAASVTRRNARRTIVSTSLREVARRRRVKRGVLLCVLGPYSKLDRVRMYVVWHSSTVFPGVNRQLCRISNRRDYSTRSRRWYSSFPGRPSFSITLLSKLATHVADWFNT